MTRLDERKQIHRDESKIYHTIKEAIQNGIFPPGYRLVERDLGEKFNTSRTPVRTAIKRLVVEGYVEQSPNKGAIVKIMTIEDIFKLLEVREVLEGAACRLAVKHMKQKEKDDLKKLIMDMEEAIKRDDFIKYYGLSGVLHKTIMKSSNNQYLYEMAERVNLQTTRFQFRNLLVTGRIKKSLQEHKDIVDKILEGDGFKAEDSMRSHIVTVKGMLKNYSNEDKQYFTF